MSTEPPSNPDQLMAKALGVCWHSPTADRWPCAPVTAAGVPATDDSGRACGRSFRSGSGRYYDCGRAAGHLGRHSAFPDPAQDDGREALLALCERAFVAQDDWCNRDSSAAQRQLGECYALLRAGCDYSDRTDGDTHWVYVEFRGFDAFEWGFEHTDSERFYVPTAERLDRAGGKDWY